MKPDPKWSNLISFLKSLPKGGQMAELGVWRGTFAREAYDIVKPDRMYLVDWWAQYSNSSSKPETWVKVKRQTFEKFGAAIEAKQVKVIEEDFCVAALQVPADHLDYLHHDGDEREAQVSRALRAWWRTLKKGGIWMGHGFDNGPWHGTIPAVIQFLKDYPGAEMLAVLGDRSHYVLRKNA